MVQWTSKKRTKKHNASAELLFCSQNQLFFDIAVALVIIIAKLPIDGGGHELYSLCTDCDLLFYYDSVTLELLKDNLTT